MRTSSLDDPSPVAPQAVGLSRPQLGSAGHFSRPWRLLRVTRAVAAAGTGTVRVPVCDEIARHQLPDGMLRLTVRRTSRAVGRIVDRRPVADDGQTWEDSRWQRDGRADRRHCLDAKSSLTECLGMQPDSAASEKAAFRLKFQYYIQ